MSESVSPRPSLLSDRAYDVLKAFVTVIFPAVSAFYFALGQIWHLPHTEEVVGTLAAVTAFSGAVLKLSSISYENSDAKYLGVMDGQVDPDTGKTTYSLILNGGKLDALDSAKDATFKVNNPN